MRFLDGMSSESGGGPAITVPPTGPRAARHGTGATVQQMARARYHMQMVFAELAKAGFMEPCAPEHGWWRPAEPVRVQR